MVSDCYDFDDVTFHTEDEIKWKSRKDYAPGFLRTFGPSLWRACGQNHHASEFLNKSARSETTPLGVPV